MAHLTQTLGHRRAPRPHSRLLTVTLIAAVLALVTTPIAYMLWPLPKPVAPDAPSLPIIVGGVTFNAPPAAIRAAIQRRPGVQPRIDLAFIWPSLDPPAMSVKASLAAAPHPDERIFVTIAASDSTLPPTERLKTIYPRYIGKSAAVGADGLHTQAFKAGSPYQGEELIYDPSNPGRFLLRCTSAVGNAPGMCLHERRIGGADATVRFPRDWLSDWRTVADGIDRLMAKLRPPER